MSAAVSSRQPSTRARGRVIGSSASIAAPARKASESRAARGALARRSGGGRGTGSASIVVALGSPEAPQAGDARLQHELRAHAANSCGPPEHGVGQPARPERADVAGEPVRDRRVDRDLGEVAQHALVVAAPVLGAAQRASSSRRSGTRAARPRRSRPMPCESDESIADHAEVVQHALGGHRARRARGARSAVQSPGAPPGREHVHGRDHREVLGLRVDAERDGRRGRRGEHALAAGEREQVGRVAAAAALDVERVDRAAAERVVGVLDRQRLVEPVGVDRELDVVGVGRCRARVRICSGPAPTSSWIFSPPPPARSAASTGSGRDEEPRTSSAALSG